MTEEVFEVERIIDVAWDIKSDGSEVPKYRVRWEGFSPMEDTWEPMENFVNSTVILVKKFKHIYSAMQKKEMNIQRALGNSQPEIPRHVNVLSREIESINDMQCDTNRKPPLMFYLVVWKGETLENATWESEVYLQHAKDLTDAYRKKLSNGRLKKTKVKKKPASRSTLFVDMPINKGKKSASFLPNFIDDSLVKENSKKLLPHKNEASVHPRKSDVNEKIKFHKNLKKKVEKNNLEKYFQNNSTNSDSDTEETHRAKKSSPLAESPSTSNNNDGHDNEEYYSNSVGSSLINHGKLSKAGSSCSDDKRSHQKIEKKAKKFSMMKEKNKKRENGLKLAVSSIEPKYSHEVKRKNISEKISPSNKLLDQPDGKYTANSSNTMSTPLNTINKKGNILKPFSDQKKLKKESTKKLDIGGSSRKISSFNSTLFGETETSFEDRPRKSIEKDEYEVKGKSKSKGKNFSDITSENYNPFESIQLKKFSDESNQSNSFGSIKSRKRSMEIGSKVPLEKSDKTTFDEGTSDLPDISTSSHPKTYHYNSVPKVVSVTAFRDTSTSSEENGETNDDEPMEFQLQNDTTSMKYQRTVDFSTADKVGEFDENSTSSFNSKLCSIPSKLGKKLDLMFGSDSDSDVITTEKCNAQDSSPDHSRIVLDNSNSTFEISSEEMEEFQSVPSELKRSRITDSPLIEDCPIDNISLLNRLETDSDFRFACRIRCSYLNLDDLPHDLVDSLQSDHGEAEISCDCSGCSTDLSDSSDSISGNYKELHNDEIMSPTKLPPKSPFDRSSSLYGIVPYNYQL